MKPVRVKTHARRQRESRRGAYRRTVEAGDCQYLGPEDKAFVNAIETVSFEQFMDKYGTTPLRQQRIRSLREYLTDYMPNHVGVKPVEVVIYGSFLTVEYPSDLDVIVHSHEPVKVAEQDRSYWNEERGLDIAHKIDHNSYCAYLTFAGRSSKERRHETGKQVRIVL